MGVVALGLGLTTQLTGETVLNETVSAGADGTTFTTREIELTEGLYDVKLSASGVTFMVDFGRVGYRIESTAERSPSAYGLLKSKKIRSSSNRLRLRGEKLVRWRERATASLVVTLDRAIDEPLRIRVVRVARDHRVLTWTGLVLIGAALLLSPRLRTLATQLAGRARGLSLDR